MYTYNAKLLRVIDGDTVELQIDLGFKVKHDCILRLYGINAPELHSKEDEKRAYAAKLFLESLLAGQLMIQTLKDKKDKYGRFLVVITNQNDIDVNKEMVKYGHAVVYFGGKREP